MDVIVGTPKRPDRRTEDREGGDRRAWGLARAVIDLFVLLKLARVVVFLKILQEAKLLEPLVTVTSGVFTGVVYSLTMKVSIVTGVLLSYAMHEFGHFFAIKLRGLVASWWVYFPFVGQWMSPPNYRSRDDVAFVAFGGPLLGGIFSLVLYLAWRVLPLSAEWSNILFTIAFLSTFLNLFNLIPLPPLDGGSITEGVSGWFRVVGFVVLIAFTWYFEQATVILIWMVILGQIRMKPKQRLLIGTLLQAAMGILIVMGFRGKSLLEEGCFFGVGLLLLWGFYRQRNMPPRKEGHRAVNLTPTERIKWGIAYCTILAALSALFAAFFPHLRNLAL